MRFRFWHTDEAPDALDPDVLSIFAESGHAPALDPSRLASSRMRVAAGLREEPAAGGWLQQRLAFGFAGGGGLWATVIGTAAAHKAATAIGIGLLIAGGTTAEVTGIGPAVRDAVSPIHSSNEPDLPAPAAIDLQTATAEAESEQLEAAPGVSVTEAPDDLPGNLTTQVRPTGGFTARGVLVTASDGSVRVLTSADDVPLEFEVGDASVHLPGPPSSSATLADYEGHLVVITGTCDLLDGVLTEDCTLDRITVLGNAGQSGPPAGTGPSGTGSQNSQPPATGQADQTEAHGPPDHASNPEGTGPPVAPGSAPAARPDDLPTSN